MRSALTTTHSRRARQKRQKHGRKKTQPLHDGAAYILSARPVRPARCRYVEDEVGKSNMTTWSTSGRSTPRISTSVATRMSVAPDAKSSMFARRVCRAISPVAALHWWPCGVG